MPKTKKLFITLACLIASLKVNAQQKTPLIEGTVRISVTEGTISCDFVLSDLPAISNYVIRLNSGMNIHYFKDLNRGGSALDYDMDTKDSIGSDEVKSYYVHESRGEAGRYIPKKLEIKYLGMYPVVTDSASGYMGGDWRGNIAFNGYSIRADGLQSCWYPEIYNKDTRKLYDLVRYRVRIICNDCKVLFVNGSMPIKAKDAIFESTIPRELALYCGSFHTAEKHGVWLLNSGMQKEDEQKLFDTANADELYYAQQLSIPFEGSLTFVQTDPVAEPKQWSFAFFAAPTTFNVSAHSIGLQSLFDAQNGVWSRKTMAHELAHYYFGTLIKPGSEFGHVIEEGFAEYMALRRTRNVEGEDIYLALLKEKVRNLEYLQNEKPFNQVKTEGDYGNREYYLYNYAPILFCAIEKEIGEKSMWGWLQTMVNNRNDYSDYNFMVNALRHTLKGNDALIGRIISKYFESSSAAQNAGEELGI
jgi:hypothetical protein